MFRFAKDPFFDSKDDRHSSMRRNVWVCLWVAILLSFAAVGLAARGNLLGANLAKDLVQVFLMVAFPSQFIQKAIERIATKQDGGS